MFEIFLSILAGMSFAFLSTVPGNQFPPPLDRREEEALFVKYINTSDTEARSKLISHNLRLVAHVVRKYYSTHPSQEDLVSIGTIGLIKAIDTFKCETGARFATYGAKCIQNATLSRMGF